MRRAVYYKRKRKRKKFSYRDVLKDLFPWKGDRPSEIIRKIVFLIALIVFGTCAYYIADYYRSVYNNNSLYDNIQNVYYNSSSVTNNLSQDYVEFWDYLSGAERLLKLNPETVGYINIPDTRISYPIVQKKDETEGNTYYLNKDFDLGDSKSGAIFLDWRCSLDDVVDGQQTVPNSDNLIVYGHDMKDEAMFGTLKYYKDNYSYYGEHPIIELNSNYRSYKYKIFAVCFVDSSETGEHAFDYYNQINFQDEKSFYDYVNNCKRRTMVLNDVDVKYGDSLLTLSTCNEALENGKTLIVARKVRDGEDANAGTQNNSRNPNPLMPDDYYKWTDESYDWDAEFVPYG